MTDLIHSCADCNSYTGIFVNSCTRLDYICRPPNEVNDCQSYNRKKPGKRYKVSCLACANCHSVAINEHSDLHREYYCMELIKKFNIEQFIYCQEYKERKENQ